MYNFNLDSDELQKFYEWRNTLSESYTGANGGRFTFSFTPTNLGLVRKITDAITNEILDLTDYDGW